MVAMFKKPLIIAIGLGIASFVVINVGMYFFLSATQPKAGVRADGAGLAQMKADSAAHPGEAKADSAAPHGEGGTTHTMAAVDTTVKHESPVAEPIAEAAPAETKPEEPAANITTETPAEDAHVEPEKAADAAATEANAEAVMQAAKDGDEKEMAKLAKLLEAMKPAESADIASHLTTEQIVTLMMKMKDRAAGKMLAALPIEQAARVAERMSQTASRSRGGK
jgi:flagellar motility protein MotE (MotC chaperone)